MSSAAEFPEPGSDVAGAPPPPPGATSTFATTGSAATDRPLRPNGPAGAVWVAGAIVGFGAAVLVYVAAERLRRKT